MSQYLHEKIRKPENARSCVYMLLPRIQIFARRESTNLRLNHDVLIGFKNNDINGVYAHVSFNIELPTEKNTIAVPHLHNKSSKF